MHMTALSWILVPTTVFGAKALYEECIRIIDLKDKPSMSL